MSNGLKEKDFLLFNSEIAEMDDVEINENNLSFIKPNKDLKDVQEVYNSIWSCNMLFAFVIMKDGILLFSLKSDIVVKCNIHSIQFIQKFEKIQDDILKQKTLTNKRGRTA